MRKSERAEETLTADLLPLSLSTSWLGPRAESRASSMSSSSYTGNQNRTSEPSEIISISDSPSPSRVRGNEGQTVKNEGEEDDDVMIIPDEEIPYARKDKDKGKGKAIEATPTVEVSNDVSFPALPENLLSTYICPICLSTVTNACLTPCGHVLCGLCLFSAVKSGIKRGLDLGIPLGLEGTTARCPVCRANLKGWDGKGAGVIPLKIRTVTAL